MIAAIQDAPMTEEAAPTATVDLAQLSDDELVLHAQAGESEAFGLLLVRLESPVRRFIWRLLGTHDAEDDIVQDVLKIERWIDADNGYEIKKEMKHA